MMGVKYFEDLEIWKEARKLSKEIYGLTRLSDFAKDYGLADMKMKGNLISLISVIFILLIGIALSGCTPLHDAAIRGDIDSVRNLLNRGADVNEKDHSGRTALFFAVANGHLDTAKLLIEKGADVNAKNSDGWTALFMAAAEGHLDIAKLLIEKGADVEYTMEKLGRHWDSQVGLAGKDMLIRLEQKYKAAAAQPPVSPAAKDKPSVPSAPRVQSDVDELPAIKAKPNKNSYAIVIGIESYRQKLPKADFAAHDAQTMTEYLTKVMGYPEENVVTLINDRATMSDLTKYFEKWLPNNIEKDGTVFIYYSGHGAPNPKTGDAYLVPFDGDPSFIDQTGYSLKRLYDNLGKLQAKEIIVALDSCFSGAGGRSVIAKGARPLVMTMEKSAIPSNAAVLSAASGEQISSTYEEKGHGLFTYFMLKGLKGEGDTNGDGKVEIGELFEYIKPQVERIARKTYNNEQLPQLIAPVEIIRQKLIER